MIFRKIDELISKYESIVIFHHINPDGDCLGSQFGLKELIKDNFPKIKVYAIGRSNKVLSFMNFEHDEIPSQSILAKSLGIVLDANYADRIQYSELITDKKIHNILRIDHHKEEDDINPIVFWVDSSYCATAEQITELAITRNWKISPRAASLLYLGIYTDSGRFLFDKTSSRTFELTAKLLRFKFDVQFIHNNLTKRTKAELIFQKEVLNNFKTQGNVIYYFLSFEKAKELDISLENRNRVDFLANISPYSIWIFFIENENGSIRVRLRSNKHNIHQIAKKYNGGGHEKASGAIINSQEQIVEIVNMAEKIAQ